MINCFLIKKNKLLLKDIDECESDLLNECQKNTKCINEIGSYKCVCNEGFEGNGLFCQGFWFYFFFFEKYLGEIPF